MKCRRLAGGTARRFISEPDPSEDQPERTEAQFAGPLPTMSTGVSPARRDACATRFLLWDGWVRRESASGRCVIPLLARAAICESIGLPTLQATKALKARSTGDWREMKMFTFAATVARRVVTVVLKNRAASQSRAARLLLAPIRLTRFGSRSRFQHAKFDLF